MKFLNKNKQMLIITSIFVPFILPIIIRSFGLEELIIGRIVYVVESPVLLMLLFLAWTHVSKMINIFWRPVLKFLIICAFGAVMFSFIGAILNLPYLQVNVR